MQNSRNRNLIKYLKYFIAIIIGLLIGINLHLFVPITFIPKKIPYSTIKKDISGTNVLYVTCE